MANAMYELGVNKIMTGDIDLNDAGTTIKVALVDTGVYTFSQAHEFYSSVSSAVIGTPQTIANKTVGSAGAKTFDGDNVTFSAVSGNSVEAFVIYKDTGVAGTSPLVAYFDTATGLPVTPNGGDISISFNASGIFKL